MSKKMLYICIFKYNELHNRIDRKVFEELAQGAKGLPLI